MSAGSAMVYTIHCDSEVAGGCPKTAGPNESIINLRTALAMAGWVTADWRDFCDEHAAEAPPPQ